MEVRTTSKALFPKPVSGLLTALFSVGFFEHSMLIGSWVMPLYEEFFGISYVLRTMDIDFAVQILKGKTSTRADLQQIIVDQGFTPFFSESGIQKFSREGFTVEFITHRKGNRDEHPVLAREWNLNAVALPFVNILSGFPFKAECPGHTVMAPVPEAFFLHKLITAMRRTEGGKRSKDLEQCSAISSRLNEDRLGQISRSVRLSSATLSAIRMSCEMINFPPQRLGLKW